jgi:hypothetical protein
MPEATDFRFTALLVLGCATPIPDSAKIGTDTGGLAGVDGLCGDRTAGVGGPAIERVVLTVDCTTPGNEELLNNCTEASISMRDSMGGISHLKGLSSIEIALDHPKRASGRTQITVVPLNGEGTLSDGATPVLTIDVPTSPAQVSLQVFPEDRKSACQDRAQCAFMGITAALPTTGKVADEYPLGSAASGVFLLESIGWDEDPVVLELEVPFFAPESDEATVCADGLIHYARR